MKSLLERGWVVSTVTSLPTPSIAAPSSSMMLCPPPFTINIAESNFWHTQLMPFAYALKHEKIQR